MDRMLLNTCHGCFRQQVIRTPIRYLASQQNARIHTTGFQAAKATKAKQPQKKKQLDYKPPTRKFEPTSPQSSSQSPSTSPPAAKANPYRFRTHPFIGACIAALFLGVPIGYFITQPSSSSSETSIAPTDYAAQADVSSRYSAIATTFDSSVDSTESTMGIHALRKKLVSQARGDVLEVSIGTGRNLEYYDWDFGGRAKIVNGSVHKGKVRSLTAVDISEEMLEIAHQRFGEKFPGILGVRWIIADASQPGVIPSPPRNANERSGNLEGRKYDTVIQTFGLCSVSDPVALLQNLRNLVKEEEGRILLLEHGRARFEWLNSLLDKNAEKHAKEFGCWWNRDIGDIVEKSGLEVVEIRRPKWWHAGTTWWVELKRPKGKEIVEKKVEEPKLAMPIAGKEAQITPTSPPVARKSWWWYWS